MELFSSLRIISFTLKLAGKTFLSFSYSVNCFNFSYICNFPPPQEELVNLWAHTLSFKVCVHGILVYPQVPTLFFSAHGAAMKLSAILNEVDELGKGGQISYPSFILLSIFFLEFLSLPFFLFSGQIFLLWYSLSLFNKYSLPINGDCESSTCCCFTRNSPLNQSNCEVHSFKFYLKFVCMVI